MDPLIDFIYYVLEKGSIIIGSGFHLFSLTLIIYYQVSLINDVHNSFI